MYVANHIKGIGEVTESTDTHVTVFFYDYNEEKVLIKKLIKIYDTEEEAMASLEPKSNILEEIEAENLMIKEGVEASFKIEERNTKAFKDMMNIM